MLTGPFIEPILSTSNQFLAQLSRPVGAVAKGIAIGAEGLGFDSRAGKIQRSVANGSPSLRHFFGAVLPQALSCGDEPRH